MDIPGDIERIFFSFIDGDSIFAYLTTNTNTYNRALNKDYWFFIDHYKLEEVFCQAVYYESIPLLNFLLKIGGTHIIDRTCLYNGFVHLLLKNERGASLIANRLSMKAQTSEIAKLLAKLVKMFDKKANNCEEIEMAYKELIIRSSETEFDSSVPQNLFLTRASHCIAREIVTRCPKIMKKMRYTYYGSKNGSMMRDAILGALVEKEKSIGVIEILKAAGRTKPVIEQVIKDSKKGTIDLSVHDVRLWASEEIFAIIGNISLEFLLTLRDYDTMKPMVIAHFVDGYSNYQTVRDTNIFEQYFEGIRRIGRHSLHKEDLIERQQVFAVGVSLDPYDWLKIVKKKISSVHITETMLIAQERAILFGNDYFAAVIESELKKIKR